MLCFMDIHRVNWLRACVSEPKTFALKSYGTHLRLISESDFSITMTYCFFSESLFIFVSSLSCLPSSKVREVVTEALMSVLKRWWQNSGLEDTRM